MQMTDRHAPRRLLMRLSATANRRIVIDQDSHSSELSTVYTAAHDPVLATFITNRKPSLIQPVKYAIFSISAYRGASFG